MISISKEWMGETLKSTEYELNEIDPEMVKWQKENIPRIQKNIQEYEEERRGITVGKTEQNRI